MVKHYTELMEEEKKEEFYKELIQRANDLRIRTLFEEPCPLYEEVEDELE